MSEEELKQKAARDLPNTKDALERLRLQCLIRGHAGIKSLGRSFRVMDDDGNRSLDLIEFKRGLKQFGVTDSDSDIEALFKKLDTNNSEKINYDEFLLALRPSLSKARIALVEMAFNKLDKTGDGVITVDDLKNVYHAGNHSAFISGEKTREEVFDEFLSNFEAQGHVDGKITKEEFINFYTGVSASIDNDAYFDLMMRNAWKL